MPTVSSLLNWLGSQDQNLDVVDERGHSPAFTRRGDRMVITFPDASLLESTKTFHEVSEAEAGPVDGTTKEYSEEPVPGSPASDVPNKAVATNQRYEEFDPNDTNSATKAERKAQTGSATAKSTDKSDERENKPSTTKK